MVPPKAASSTPQPGSFSCLIIEDDPAFASLVSEVVRSEGGNTTHCATLRDALAATEHKAFDLMLLDNHLPDGRSYDFFNRITRRHADAPVVMITGLPNLSEALALTRNGLFDYLTKPVDVEALTACLRRARLRIQSTHAADAPPDPQTALGASAAMREVLTKLRQAAQHPGATVLLTGESGVGKDVAARTLHRLTYGSRSDVAPYVAVNCAAVPADMFEAELFGAERGAYTGADRKRLGLVASAQGGTLFLDEIGEVPLPLQAKLLRLLEGREYRVLGGTGTQTFDGRFVAATNKSLQAEVQAGRFREDLLFRIEVLVVEIPPLRQRREDIPALCEVLLGQLASRYGRPLPLIRDDDQRALTAYPFPGNVRELRNILERGLLRTPRDSRWLTLDPVWFEARGTPAASPARPPATATVAASAVPESSAPLTRGVPGAVADDALPPERASLTPLDAQEYRMLRAALRECKGGIRRAAAKVGLSPQALLRRLEKWPELREDGASAP